MHYCDLPTARLDIGPESKDQEIDDSVITVTPINYGEKGASLAWEPTSRKPGTMPGIRCPTCLKNGNEIWVLPGKACWVCGTECDF